MKNSLKKVLALLLAVAMCFTNVGFAFSDTKADETTNVAAESAGSTDEAAASTTVSPGASGTDAAAATADTAAAADVTETDAALDTGTADTATDTAADNTDTTAVSTAAASDAAANQTDSLLPSAADMITPAASASVSTDAIVSAPLVGSTGSSIPSQLTAANIVSLGVTDQKFANAIYSSISAYALDGDDSCLLKKSDGTANIWDDLQNASCEDILNLFCGQITAKDKGITDITGITLIHHAGSIDLSNKDVTDAKANKITNITPLLMGNNVGQNTYYWGYTDDGKYYPTQLYIQANPIDTFVSDIGGNLNVVDKSYYQDHTIQRDFTEPIIILKQNSNEADATKPWTSAYLPLAVYCDKAHITLNENNYEVASPSNLNIYAQVGNWLKGNLGDVLDFDGSHSGTLTNYGLYWIKRAGDIKIGYASTENEFTSWSNGSDPTLSTETQGRITFHYSMVANVKVYTTVNLLSNAVAKIEKVDSTDSSIKLQGAKFELFSDSGCTKPVKDSHGNDYISETGTDGIATFEGLVADQDYYTKEISAPDGYNADLDTVYTLTAKDGGATITNSLPLTITPQTYTSETDASDPKVQTYPDDAVTLTAGKGVFIDTLDSSSVPDLNIPATSTISSITITKYNGYDSQGKAVSDTNPTVLSGLTNEEYATQVKTILTEAAANDQNVDISISYSSLDVDPVVAENTPLTTEVPIALTKTLNGAAPAGHPFTFQLTDNQTNKVSTVVTDDNGNIDFGTIGYTYLDYLNKYDADTGNAKYTYTVKEVIPGTSGGYVYDTTEEKITVTLTYDKDSHSLKAALSYSPSEDTEGTKPYIFNNVYNAEGTIAFKATKTLDQGNSKLAAGAYKFGVYSDEACTQQVGSTVTNKADGSVDFNALTFYTEANTTGTEDSTKIYNAKTDGTVYPYFIKEIAGTQAGITYDTTVYQVDVTLKDNLNGTLTPNAVYTNITNPDAGDVQALTFNNNYYAKGDVALVGTKTLGTAKNEKIAAEEFTFKVTDKDGNIVATGKTEAGTGTAKIDWTVTDSSAFTYEKGIVNGSYVDETGTYVYLITEDKGTSTAVQYTAPQVTMTVTVTDDNSGHLTAAAVYSPSVNNEGTQALFNNGYEPVGEADLSAKKTIDLFTIDANYIFDFSLKNEKGVTIASASNDENGIITFPALKYALADLDGADSKTFNYTITENAIDKDAYPYISKDTSVKKVAVTVTNDGSDKLTTQVKYDGTDTVPSFTNVYKAKAQAKLHATKLLTPSSSILIPGFFSFSLYEVKDGKAGETPLTTASNMMAGAVDFTIDYEISKAKDDSGVHIYEMKEDTIAMNGIKADDAVYYAKVTVTKPSTPTGEAVVETKYYSDAACTQELTSEPVFTNHHMAKGTITVKAVKKVTGIASPAGFNFTLTDNADTTRVYKAVSDENGDISFTLNYYLDEDADGNYKAGVDDTGYHTYTLAEVNDGAEGILYDSSSYTVNTHVSDQNSDTLLVLGTSHIDDAVFTNSSEVKWQPKAVKMLTGREQPLTAGEFSFRLIETTDGADRIVEEVKNAADGAVDFSEITYTEPGVHTYQIYETSADADGIICSTERYTVKVTVSYSEENKKLTADAAYTDKDGKTVDGAVFENTYSASGKAKFSVTKNYKQVLSSAAFMFKLTATDKDHNALTGSDAYTDAVTVTTMNGTGAAAFKEIKYTSAGTYYYTIEELAGSESYIAYDSVPQHLTVAVTDDQKGHLNADCGGTDVGTDSYTVNFVNAYYASTEASFNVLKTVKTGYDTVAPADPGTYFFKITDLSDGAAYTKAATQVISNGADGKAVAGPFKYAKDYRGNTAVNDVGMHVYQVEEVLNANGDPLPEGGTANGITYDTNVYKVTVNVQDDEKGNMTASVVYPA